MSELFERIRYARKHAGLSQESLGAACSPPVSKAGAGLWESSNPDKRTRPNYENLKAIAKLTGATLEWLLSDESELDHKTYIRTTDLTRTEGSSIAYIPLLSWDSVRQWPDKKAIAREKIAMSAEINTGPNGFALIVEGDAMSPDFPAGGIITVNPDAKTSAGDLVIAYTDDQETAIFRRFETEGRRKMLVAINNRYPVENCTQIVGRVMSYTRTL